MNSSQNRAVLILHPGSLGDVILSLDAIRAVRKNFSSHDCILLVQTEIGKLLKVCGEIDAFLSIENSVFGEFASQSPQLHPNIIKILKQCTHVVGWFQDHGHRVSINLRKLGIRNIHILSPKDEKLQCVHMADRYRETLYPWCLDSIESCSRLFTHKIMKQEKKVFEKSTRHCENFEQLLVVHPGSGSPHKCLSPQRFGLIIKRLLKSSGRKLIICQGPSDEEIVIALQQVLSPIPNSVVRNLNLTDMVDILSEGNVFIGHDSGLSHLAAALGVPTIALFGPTDPQRWQPVGCCVEVITDLACQCHQWFEVQNCLQKVCLLHSIDNVVEVVERVLASTRNPLPNETT